jgi:hypothetical protein
MVSFGKPISIDGLYIVVLLAMARNYYWIGMILKELIKCLE